MDHMEAMDDARELKMEMLDRRRHSRIDAPGE
jgi:hypothetical protein